MSNTENVIFVDPNLADDLIGFFAGVQDDENHHVTSDILDEMKEEFLQERQKAIKQLTMDYLKRREEQLALLRQQRADFRKEEQKRLNSIEYYRMAASLAIQGFSSQEIYQKLKKD